VNETVEAVVTDLSSQRFRWWRWAKFVALPTGMLFLVGIVLYFVQGNGGFMEHPLTMLAFGIWPVYLGMLLVWQPRTYTEYVRLCQMLRRANGAYDDRDFLGRHRRTSAVVAFFGGLLALFVGMSFLFVGISRL
jgi:hypothetical protein